MTNLLFG